MVISKSQPLLGNHSCPHTLHTFTYLSLLSEGKLLELPVVKAQTNEILWQVVPAAASPHIRGSLCPSPSPDHIIFACHWTNTWTCLYFHVCVHNKQLVLVLLAATKTSVIKQRESQLPIIPLQPAALWGHVIAISRSLEFIWTNAFPFLEPLLPPALTSPWHEPSAPPSAR